MGWMGGVAALDEKVMAERARPIRWMGCHSRRIGARASLISWWQEKVLAYGRALGKQLFDGTTQMY